MSKFKTVINNIKYFVPLLLKISPMVVISMIIVAIIGSIENIAFIIFPKMIIEELCGNMSKDVLIKIVLLFVGCLFICWTLMTIFDNIRYYYIRKADFKIDEIFNKKIASIDYFHIEDPKFADELSYAKQCLNQYSNGIYSVTYAISTLIQSTITIVSVFGIVLANGRPDVLLITLVGVLISVKIYGKYQQLDEEYNKQYVRTNRRQWYYNKSIMSFRLQKELRLYNTYNFIKQKGSEVNKEIDDGLKELTKKNKRYNYIDTTYRYIFTEFITIAILLYSVLKGNMTLPIFTMLFSSLGTLNNSMSNLVYGLKTYYKDCTYQENFIKLMNMESVFKEGKKPITEIKTIEFKNVSFKYPRTENYILKNVSFVINNKEKTSLVGLNGAGKTTIIKLLCRFFEVEEGEILINGINLNEYSYDEYMKCLSVVFQDFKIISFSVQNNIEIDENNKEKLYDVLERAKVLDRILELPNKENTYINKWFDKTGVEFSGGEMQKFALARALYKDASFVILDEPTSALDAMTEAEIYHHFKDVVGEKLCMFISHRLSSCIFSDNILVLDGNKIVESGTHEQLMKNNQGLYYKMFKAQAEYYK